jgi:soluble lytic murein transglycosylase-like protein
MSGLSKLTVIVFLLLTSLLLAMSVHAEPKKPVYKFVDVNGQVSFTDDPKHDGFVKLEKTWKGWREPIQPNNYRDNKKRFSVFVIDASTRHQVPEYLVSAVIHAESYYNPYAISKAGAVGLMQLMPGTAKRYGVHDRQNPEQNIEGGVRYLRDLLEMFDGNVQLALAAYNAGENAVKKYGYRIPPYKETQHYVKKVSDLSQKYQAQAI